MSEPSKLQVHAVEHPVPHPATKGIKADIISGFLVFLIALPLCLGIAMASGFPPVGGLVTAIIGGVVATHLGSARLTIKGPAAGLIVIALGAVTELGQGDTAAGYRKALAVGVVAGVVQVILALSKAGVLGDLMPRSVVHGMLAAIGVIILSKQTHTLLGVSPHAKEPLELIAEIPGSVRDANMVVAAIGVLALAILFGMPALKNRLTKRIPAPMAVLSLAIPIALLLDFRHAHAVGLAGHSYSVGPKALVQLPANLLNAITFPDFSEITSGTSIKYIVMFALVGSIESLLSVSAVDSLDPAKRASDSNKDLLAVGIGNVIAAALGGLPMISEIVRSKANIDSGAQSRWSNFFHGLFLLAFVAFLPGVLGQIPLAALAAMLIYTGSRLASPAEFKHAYEIGKDQLALFIVTCAVTLATDLLVGVGAGIVLKIVMHIARGVPLGQLFKNKIETTRDGETLHVHVRGAAVFTNLLGLRRALSAIPGDVAVVQVDFSDARVVDHSTLERIRSIADEWPHAKLQVVGLDKHKKGSTHKTSVHTLAVEPVQS
ncbi:MAG: SulP family inorganic anion transporter [Polyangiaceae bacterium]|nr:SulP family inorganic anion transporter [Polyangiaceae bacterium]